MCVVGNKFNLQNDTTYSSMHVSVELKWCAGMGILLCCGTRDWDTSSLRELSDW